MAETTGSRGSHTPDDRPGVLMLTKGLGRGGAERLLAGIARHIDPERFRLEMAYLLPWKDAFVEEIEEAGVPVHCLHAVRPVTGTWLPRLRELVRERDISLVHTHMPQPAAQARLALGGRNGPAFIHTEHNLWSRYRRPTRWANALTYRRNRAALAVSEEVAASVRSSVPVTTLVHGAELDAITALPDDAGVRARRDLGLSDDAPVVGTVGNFTAKKDHATLLRAFATVRTERPGARLVLVGLGPLRDELINLAGDLGLGDAVLFTGMRDDVYEILAALDVFVLSSRYEGLPISLLEAMASGVPPVVTRVGGIPEVVSDGRDGLLVPPGDPDTLAVTLLKLLADPPLRTTLGASARGRAAHFDLVRAVRALEDVYEQVLTERP